MHVSQRKGLYLKAYFSVMFRTSLVAWWKAVNKPFGFTLEHVSKLVCDSELMGLKMQHGFYYDFLNEEYFPHDFDQNENEILLDSSVKLEQIREILVENNFEIRQDKAAVWSVTSFPGPGEIPLSTSVILKFFKTTRNVRRECIRVSTATTTTTTGPYVRIGLR